MELYKKYRPNTLSKMIGNEASIQTIEKKLEAGTLPHTLLLSGPSGCGKTTIARIIKDKLDCHTADFYEVNCANRNGVELARDIESKYRMRPMSGGVRIWLLDEAHKLTAACSESLLKPLEDTPEHVYFILATTDPQKLIKTIRTRACEITVSALTHKESETLIKKVCKKEKIKITEDVMDNLIDAGQGSARKLLVALDKIRDLDEDEMLVASQAVYESESQAFEIYRAICDKNWPKCSTLIKNSKDDPEGVRRMILACASNCLLNPKQAKFHTRAFDVLGCFEQPLYDLGKPGLIMCSYDAIKGD